MSPGWYSPGSYASPGTYPLSAQLSPSRPLPTPPCLSDAASASASQAERPDSAGSDSSASAAAGPSSIRLQTPRKRFVARSRVPVRPMASPRRRRKDSRVEREETGGGAARPGLGATLGYVLAPVRLLLAPVHMVLTPILWHIINIAILAFIVALFFYLAQAWLRRSIGAMFSPNSSLPATVAMLPFRALATPACLLANIGCPLSLLAAPNMTARPFWQMVNGGAEVDVAAVSRELSREARQAKDIFESLTALGDGRMTAGLGHVRSVPRRPS